MNRTGKMSSGKLYILLLALLSVGLLALIFLPTISTQAADVKMMYADVEKIIRDSKAGRDILDQVRKEGDKIREEAEKVGGDLTKERDSLLEQRSVLSPSAFAKKEQSFQARLQEEQRKVSAENERILRGRQQGFKELEGVLAKIFEEILEEKDLSLILNRQALLTATPDVDLTSEVIARLDRRLSSVDVEFGPPLTRTRR